MNHDLLHIQVPGLLKMTSLTQLVAIIMALGLLAGCEVTKSSLPTTPTYPCITSQPALMVGKEGPGGEVVQGPVACTCQCNRLDYQPVCSDGVEYYNPCYAGCQVQSHPNPSKIKERSTTGESSGHFLCVLR